jgi:hypothetical protein
MNTFDKPSQLMIPSLEVDVIAGGSAEPVLHWGVPVIIVIVAWPDEAL